MSIPAHLRSLQALELAVRTGSLKAASEPLGITPAAVGQRIKTLEDYLGVELVVRARSGIRPTRELAVALAHLSAGFRELETAASILDFQRAQEVHIVADADWGELWLAPRLAVFKQDNPGLLFCVNGMGDVPPRVGRPPDCQVRLAEALAGHGSDILFRDYLLPVSSPENTKRISRLPKRERLEGFPLLHLECYRDDPSAIGWPEWVRRHGYRSTAPERGIRYKRVVHALEAVFADSGLIICGLALVEKEVRAKRLSLPFPRMQGAWLEHSYLLTFADDALRRPGISRFRDWLVAEARQTERQLLRLVGR